MHSSSDSTALPRPRRSSGSTPHWHPALQPRPRGSAALRRRQWSSTRNGRAAFCLSGAGRTAMGTAYSIATAWRCRSHCWCRVPASRAMQLALIVQEQYKRLGVQGRGRAARDHPVLRAPRSGKFRRQHGELRRASRRRGASSTGGDAARRPTMGTTATGPPTRSCAPPTWHGATRHRPSAPGCAGRGRRLPGGVPLHRGPGLRHAERTTATCSFPVESPWQRGVDMDAGRHGPLR